MATPQPGDAAGLEYARRLYATVVDWYKSAEAKAQILLSLDGIFASFVVSSMLVGEAEADELFGSFGWETWLLFGLMLLALAGSIVCCLLCVVSRVMSDDEVARRYGRWLDGVPPEPYPPEMLWFFQTLSRLDESRYADQVVDLSGEDEARALADQIVLLSRRVLRKHQWVNRGFLLGAATLVLFLLGGVSFVARVAVG